MRSEGNLAINHSSKAVRGATPHRSFNRLVPKVLLGAAVLFLGPTSGLSTLRADDKASGWQHDFTAAEAQAKARQVALVVHFHASWCGPCRRMESEVLSNAQVTSLLGNGIIG
ncbi:MAG: thioredoxin family protein, partial [Planctomycetota bacterium]